MLSSNPGASVYIQISVDASKYKLHLNIKHWLGKMVFICSLTPELLLEHVALRELPINAKKSCCLSSGGGGQRKDWWRMEEKIMSRLHFFFFFFPSSLHFFKLPEGLPRICNQQQCVSHFENQLFTLPSHTHTHTLSSFLFLTQIYLHFSLLCSSLFTSVSPHLLAPSFPSIPLPHIYIQAYLLTTVFPHWSPLLKTT